MIQMVKQERTRIFESDKDSTLIIIDKSTEHNFETEMLSLAKGKGWVRYSENTPFNEIIKDLLLYKGDMIWQEVSLPIFTGEN